MQKKPFPITKENAAKSPMKTVENVKQTLDKYHKGIPIGFSRTSSLKSMGLLPRQNGTYVLGEKYSS
jgi:hypothetical protein